MSKAIIFNKAQQKNTTLDALLDEPLSVVAQSLQGHFETHFQNSPTAQQVADATEMLHEALARAYDDGYDAGAEDERIK